VNQFKSAILIATNAIKATEYKINSSMVKQTNGLKTD
jgi:hypothetical protein